MNRSNSGVFFKIFFNGSPLLRVVSLLGLRDNNKVSHVPVVPPLR
jgi:hypothetical protein